MTTSVLNSTKKTLGLSNDYDVFDDQIIMHINSVFSTLHQLGLGPEDGFEIDSDSANWEDFIGTVKNINSVKTYMYLKVRMLFDPPATSFHIQAMDKQIEELEFRLNVAGDKTWTPPDPDLDLEDDLIIDGGSA